MKARIVKQKELLTLYMYGEIARSFLDYCECGKTLHLLRVHPDVERYDTKPFQVGSKPLLILQKANLQSPSTP